MFWNKKEKVEKSAINWIPLTALDQLDEIREESRESVVVIFKHSTRCSISGTALHRMERGWTDDLNAIKVYFLDLIAYRNVSNEIANAFRVVHESPQLIVIKNGEVVYSASHNSIRPEDLLKFV